MQHTVRADQVKEGDVINVTGQPETVDFVDAGPQFATVYTNRNEHILDAEQTVTVNR